jgi:malonate transporter
MTNFFLLGLPIFAVIGGGWAATRTRLVAQGALDALNAFAFRFALPALLLRLIAGQPLRQSFEPGFYTGYLATGVIIFSLGSRHFASRCRAAPLCRRRPRNHSNSR